MNHLDRLLKMVKQGGKKLNDCQQPVGKFNISKFEELYENTDVEDFEKLGYIKIPKGVDAMKHFLKQLKKED